MGSVGKFKGKSKLSGGTASGSVKKLQAALGMGLKAKVLGGAPSLQHAKSVVSKGSKDGDTNLSPLKRPTFAKQPTTSSETFEAGSLSLQKQPTITVKDSESPKLRTSKSKEQSRDDPDEASQTQNLSDAEYVKKRSRTTGKGKTMGAKRMTQVFTKKANNDLDDTEEKTEFYKPIQLQDYENMVEIESDDSTVLESPEA